MAIIEDTAKDESGQEVTIYIEVDAARLGFIEDSFFIADADKDVGSSDSMKSIVFNVSSG